jgi:hypothetical protein
MIYEGYVDIDDSKINNVDLRKSGKFVKASETGLQEIKIEDIELMRKIGEGDDGSVYMIQCSKGMFAGKVSKRGFSSSFVNAVQNRGVSSLEGFPKYWCTVDNEELMLCNYITKPYLGALSRNEYSSVSRQVRTLNSNGFVHLDVARRNIIAGEDMCALVDFDLICQLGKIHLGPYPLDISTENTASRLPALKSDDKKGLDSIKPFCSKITESTMWTLGITLCVCYIIVLATNLFCFLFSKDPDDADHLIKTTIISLTFSLVGFILGLIWMIALDQSYSDDCDLLRAEVTKLKEEIRDQKGKKGLTEVVN